MGTEDIELHRRPERVVTAEAQEIIGLFRRAREAAAGEIQDSLFQEFAQKLVAAVTPRGQTPHVGDMLHQMKDIALGKRIGPIYIGSGTAGQRIRLDNYVFVKNEDRDKLNRWEKNTKKTDLGDGVELETLDQKPRWMRYVKPEGENWKFGKEYWERYMETFGGEVVDLLEVEEISEGENQDDEKG